MRIKYFATLFAVLVPLAGCEKHALLMSQTALGVDLSTTEGVNGVIGFKRSELAIIPKKEDGTGHSTVMALDNRYDFGKEYCVNQTIATGIAADVAAEAILAKKSINRATDDSAYAESRSSDAKDPSSPLIFSTYTSWGLADINVTGSGPQNSLSLFHYKRSEGAIIPVEKNENIRSIYGKFYLYDKTGEATKHYQVMATGTAANRYAGAIESWDSIKESKCNPPKPL